MSFAMLSAMWCFMYAAGCLFAWVVTEGDRSQGWMNCTAKWMIAAALFCMAAK